MTRIIEPILYLARTPTPPSKSATQSALSRGEGESGARENTETPEKPPAIGQPSPAGARCGCGTWAVALCQCGATFCGGCWFRHSHLIEGQVDLSRSRTLPRRPLRPARCIRAEMDRLSAARSLVLKGTA